jgi:hypothetical protein
MLPKTRENLSLFVEKADSLRQKSFSQDALRDGLTVTLHMNTSGGGVQRNLPDQEQIESAIVTLRLFVQGNDAISLEKIDKLLTDQGLSFEWKKYFRQKHNQLKTYLDNVPETGVELMGNPNSENCDNRNYSNREIFDTFVYGEIAHTDSKHRPTYLIWRSLPIYPLFEYVFISIVMDIVLLIGEIADRTRLELLDNREC